MTDIFQFIFNATIFFLKKKEIAMIIAALEECSNRIYKLNKTESTTSWAPSILIIQAHSGRDNDFKRKIINTN